jgi:hypothetical protein
MPQLEPLLLTYLQLAEASQLRHQLLVRDKLLVLVGITALELGWDEISASCRQQILLHNPRHMIRRWPDLATATGAERFRAYLKQLRRKYSPERAEHMLDALGISLQKPQAPSHRLRERAATMVESLVPVPHSNPPGRLSVQTDAALLTRKKTGPSADRSAKGRASVIAWWPFWLGLAVWVILVLIVIFGRRWTA